MNIWVSYISLGRGGYQGYASRGGGGGGYRPRNQGWVDYEYDGGNDQRKNYNRNRPPSNRVSGTHCVSCAHHQMSGIVTKPTKCHMHPVKTQVPYASSEDSDQPGHLAVHLKKTRIRSYPLSAQRRLWSDWANAQADRSSPGVHAILMVLSRCGSDALSFDPITRANKQELYIFFN